MVKFLNPCADTIGWADYTWNPVTGCEHGPEICSCSGICWARAMAKRFKQDFTPQFHPERLDVRFDKIPPSGIFVCDMGDLFGEWVPSEWIEAVLWACEENQQHRFIFLTKNPLRYKDFIFTDNCWTGTSISKPEELYRIKQLNDPLVKTIKHFISFEPILDKIVCNDLLKYNWNHIHWIIIGGLSGHKSSPAIKLEAIKIARYYQGRGIPIFFKNNLSPDGLMPQQFPEGLNL